MLSNCKVCMCDSETVVGRVRCETPPNTPLGGVEIRVGGRELHVETYTNSTGKRQALSHKNPSIRILK